jgi:Rrf2 family nitric oxide-sensitive transcriptional repressor
MQLTDSTDYSLRTLMYLNRTKSQKTLSELATTLGLSRNTLIKISNRLSKTGYVEATRGPSGGLQISKHAGSAPLGKIVQSLEVRFQLAECFSDNNKVHCTFLKSCRLKGALSGALDAFIVSLNQYTLDDITTPEVLKK